MEKAGAEIKRDLEWAFLHNTTATDGTTTSAGVAGTVPGLQPGVPGVQNPTTANNYPSATGVGGAAGTTLTNVRKTAGFQGLVAAVGATSPDAIVAPGGTNTVTVNKDISGRTGTGVVTALNETDLFDLTKDLYLAGAQPNIIMFHPSQAKFFSGLMELSGSAGNRQRMFDGAADTKVNTYVSV
ncbi:UNVERIFIED_CONTAM: hypothetical protein RF648_21635, partial [Kocuria sp. CPCC 205274]